MEKSKDNKQQKTKKNVKQNPNKKKKDQKKVREVKPSRSLMPRPGTPELKLTYGTVSDLITENQRVNVAIDPVALQKPYIAFYAYLCQSGIINQFANVANVSNVFAYVASAVQYLYEQNMLSLGFNPNGNQDTTALSPNKIPIVFRDLVTGLSAKVVHTPTKGSISYSWNTELSAINGNFTPYPIGSGTWATLTLADDNAGYLSQAYPVIQSGDAEAYSSLISFLDGIRHYQLKVVDLVFENSPLKNSVSAFARSYAYNGLGTGDFSASGYFKDVELEVPIFNLYMAMFANYGSDTRVPRFLGVNAGDSCQAFAMPMMHVPNTNTGTVTYKCIDFENIYDVVCNWIIRAKALAISSVDAGYNSNPFVGTFLFSQQDFRIMLRQALLSFFTTQYYTQFVAPVDADSGNYFQPFMVTSATYGSSQFSGLLLPEVIVENLAALKQRVMRLTNKKQYIFTPVLGRFIQDVPAVYNVVCITQNSSEPQNPTLDSYPLFSSPAQSAISLIDGAVAGGPFANLNAQYYQNVMQEWNTCVNGLNQVITATKPLNSEIGPPGLPVLCFTRVETFLDAQPTRPRKEVRVELDPKYIRKESAKKIDVSTMKAAPPPVLPLPLSISKRISNYQIAVGKGLEAIPAATSSMLSTTTLTSVGPIGDELLGILQGLILPVIRFDDNVIKPLSLSKYQTEVNETNSFNPNADNSVRPGTVGASSIVQAWQVLAGQCTRGAGGQDPMLARIMASLADDGHAGFLSSLLGGLAKTILPPELHGVVDTVSELVPL
jgi:hypothetical protein